MSLQLRIALRYLLSKKSHSAVNVISAVSMAAIAVAAMAMVCVLSVFNGFSDLSMTRLSATDPDILARAKEGRTIASADSLARAIEALPSVRRAAPVAVGQAMAAWADRQSAVVIKGVTPEVGEIVNLESSVIDGSADFLDPSGAMLSVGAAIRLGAHPDAERGLRIMVPRRKGRLNPALPMSAFLADTLTVTAVYEPDASAGDADMAVMPLSRVRRLMQYDSTEATHIYIALAEGHTASQAKEQIAAAIPEASALTLADRLEQEQTSMRMIAVEKWITFLMLALVLVMAAFNILSTMSMLIIEKQQSIATFRAMGATQAMIRGIFLSQGFLIGVTGGAAGIVIGAALCLVQQYTGVIGIGGDAALMIIDHYPVRLAATDLLAVSAIVTVVGLVAGIISAAMAGARLKPSR